MAKFFKSSCSQISETKFLTQKILRITKNHVFLEVWIWVWDEASIKKNPPPGAFHEEPLLFHLKAYTITKVDWIYSLRRPNNLKLNNLYYKQKICHFAISVLYFNWIDQYLRHFETNPLFKDFFKCCFILCPGINTHEVGLSSIRLETWNIQNIVGLFIRPKTRI